MNDNLRTLRELDIAVADRVMRWPRRDRDDDRDYEDTYFSAYDDGGQIVVFRGGAIKSAERWSPAQNIVAAMEVVEKLRAEGFSFACTLYEGQMPYASFCKKTVRSSRNAEADTLPEAICRAALALVDGLTSEETNV